MKKQMISLLLSAIIVLSSFSEMIVFANELTEEAETVNESIYTPTKIENNYNKLHFYFGEQEHTTIDNEEELFEATNNLISKNEISRSAVNTNTIVNSDEIEITIQFASDFTQTEKYIEFLKERETLKSIEDVRDFRRRLNAYSKEYHEALATKNAKYISDFACSSSYNIAYSPFTVMKVDSKNINAEELLKLCNLDNIKHISLDYERETVEDGISTWNTAMSGVGASSIISNSQYTGEGIRIGILESDGVCDDEHINLVDKNIEIGAHTNTTPHATRVTSILALMVPDADFFVKQYYKNDRGLDWFIEQECDVVNCSFSIYFNGDPNENGEYTFYNPGYHESYDALYDYQIRTHFITVIKSSGNVNNDKEDYKYNPNGEVLSPGLAYNIITVGGVEQNSSSNWIHDSDIAYKTSYLSSKPTVSAPSNITVPNTNYGYGSSYSTPIVTACVAMLMEKDSSYICHPEKVHAVITATATKTDDYDDGYGEEENTGFHEKVGAGIVNLPKMLSYTTNVHTINSVSEELRAVYSTEQMFLDQFYEFGAAISWLAYAEENPDGTYELHNTDYELFVYSSTYGLTYSSSLSKSAVELVRFTVPESDYYWIVIYQYGEMYENNTEDHIALSYYIDEGPLQ